MEKMVGDVRWGRKQLLKFLLKKMGEETILSFLYADARKAKLPLWGDGRVFLIRSNLIRDDGGAAVIRLKQPVKACYYPQLLKSSETYFSLLLLDIL